MTLRQDKLISSFVLALLPCLRNRSRETVNTNDGEVGWISRLITTEAEWER